MLIEWFVANQCYPEDRALTYLEFPSKWIWNGHTKRWEKRTREFKFGPPIGRIYSVHPTTNELFFLRILLTVVPGATGFQDLRTYQGTLYSSFKEACQACGLVGVDNEWFRLFDEAVQWTAPFQLIHLFMTVLLFRIVSNGQRLLNKYWHFMVDDFALQIALCVQDRPEATPTEYLYARLLQEVSVMFGRNGYSLESFNISTVSILSGRYLGNRLLLEEMQYEFY